MLRRFLAMASAALVASASSGCGATPTPGSTRRPPRVVRAHTATPPQQLHTSRRASILKLDWSRSVKGATRIRSRPWFWGYLAVNGQTAGGCSLMVWGEQQSRSATRWCTRMVLLAAARQPTVRRFRQPVHGQPGMMLPRHGGSAGGRTSSECPPTARFQEAVALIVTIWARFWSSTRIEGPSWAHRWTWSAASTPPIRLAASMDCRQALRGAPCRRHPPLPATKMIVVGVWQPDSEAPVLTALSYRPGQTPLLVGVDQRRRRGAGTLAAPSCPPTANGLRNGRDQRLWALNASDGR